MSTYLVTRCGKCNEPVDAVPIAQTDAARLGEIVQQAGTGKRPLQLQDQVELGRCTCPSNTAGSSDDTRTDFTDTASKQNPEPAFRWTIRQMLYLTGIISVFLVVLRNPLHHMLGVKNWAFVNSPWLLYRWLFFGIDMPPIKRGPPAGMDLFLFGTNIILAVLVGVYVLRFGYLAIRYGWRKVSER